VIQTSYKIICDGCGGMIHHGSVTEETSMDNHTEKLFFHFHDLECKTRWIDDHRQILTGTIMEAISDDK
jgi:hypothetical protein